MMSQLPALPSLDEIVKQSRRAKADAAIALSRESTPESATEQRTAKRLSIAELNDTDIAELRRRVMSGAPHDERPAWVKALDIIDLPRNALFNLAAPGIASRKARSGDRATFGMGRVNFSDVLEELGVDNRIVRGVGGFVGDVAFDPLTYIGPAGWGLKVGSGVGKGVSSVGVEVGKRGAKSLTGGIKAAARGEEVGEETVRNLLKIKGYDRNGVAALAAKGMTPDQIRQQITKDIIGADESGFGRFLRILGSDRDATGGSLAKGVFEPGASDALSAAGKAVGIEGVSQAEAKAAREFLTKFSKVNAPGIKIGKGGSQIAHIPFTEFGIQVPAFTSAARRNVALHGAMTRMLGLAPDAVTVGSGIEEAARAVEGLVRTVGDMNADDPLTSLRKQEGFVDIAGERYTRSEFEATGEELFHGTNRDFGQFASGVPNRYGKPGVDKFYFTDDESVANNFANSGGYKQVDASKYADAETGDEAVEALGELRKDLDRHIASGKQLAYVDVNDGKLKRVSSASEVSDDDLLGGDVRLYAKGRWPKVVKTKVYGKTLDLSSDGNIPSDLVDILKRDGVLDENGKTVPNYSHEFSPELVKYARERGYGKIKVRDVYESGHRSVIALPEYIGLGRNPFVELGGTPDVDPIKELANQVVAVREAVKSLQGPNKTPEEVFAAARLDEIAGLAQKNVEAVLKDMPNIGQRANLNKDIGQRVQKANREFRWLERLSDDDGFDYLPKDPDGNRYVPSDPNVRFAAAEQLRSLRKALRGAKNLKNEKAVATIREKIKQAVIGPGGMEAIDLDAADAQVAELSKQQYAGAARRLVEMSDEDAAAYEVAIKSLTDSLAAARELADAAGGSFTRHISDDARDLVELNRMVLGTNDDTIASSPLMSVRDAIKARYGDDGAVFRAVAAIEASMRKTFGTRGGVVKRATRFLERGLSEEAHNARAKSIARLSIAAKDTAEELGLGDQFKEFVEAVTAIAVRMRNDADDAYYVKSYVDDLGKEMDLAQAEAAGLRVHDNAFRQIDRFTKSGLITPERLPKMEALAKQYIDALEDLADADVYAGVLGDEARLAGYIPSAATPGARDAVRVARKNQFAPGRSGGAGDKLGQLEGFQKARTTDQVRWMGADGKMRRIFQSDLALADIPKAELSEREQKVREMVLEWQRLPNPPQWRRTDYAELNDLVASGRFQRLTAGANLTEGFFESNMLSMLSSRSASSQLSRSRKAFTDMFSQSGLTIDAKDYDTILASPGGKPVTLAGGAEGRVGKMIGSQPTVWVNGQRWRKLSADVIDRDNPLYRLIGDENAGRIYHESMADAIERVAKVFGTDEDIKRWLQAYDQFQGIWKTITLSHPSWTVGDASGNVALQLQGGMRPQAIANFGKQAIAVAWHENNIDFLRGQRVKFGGREMSGDDFIKMLVELNVWGADQASEVAKQLKRMDLMGVAQSSDDFINPPSSLQTAKRAVAAPVNAVKGAVAGAKAGESISGKVAGAAQGFGDEIMRSWIGPFFRVNRKVNNAQRAIMFMDLVDQGYDLPSAAAKVIEHMFDYADLTHTERHTLRRLLPFYSWMRNNMAYQVQQLFTNPKFAATAPKVQEAVEQMLLGEERIPNHQRPGWMRDQLAIQFAKDPDSFVMARPLLPQTDAIQPLTLLFGTEGALDFAHYFGSGLTPVIKAATDLAYGQELFSGRKLGENADAGQVPLGEYALKQFRPARELGLVGGSSAIGAAKQGVVPFAGRLALGGKFQSQPEGDVDRRLKGQYKRKEQEFRTAISRSRRNGDADGENRGIIELLKLYRRMAEVGLTDEIPKKYRPIVVGDTETATNG